MNSKIRHLAYLRIFAVLASIGNPEVIKLLAQVIEDLVKGELMQMGGNSNDPYDQLFDQYLQKTFKKTASLFAYSCEAVALLAQGAQGSPGGSGGDFQRISYEFGRNLGLAFQLIDDALDFVGIEATLGKPAAADLKLGLATAPVFFAARSNPRLLKLVRRRFAKPTDAEEALHLVLQSDGVAKTKKFAEQYAEYAAGHLKSVPDSPYKNALVEIAYRVVNRDR